MVIKYKHDIKVWVYILPNIQKGCSYKNVSSKLSKSYYEMQSLKVTSVNILRSMDFAIFHSHLRYRTVLGGDVKK